MECPSSSPFLSKIGSSSAKAILAKARKEADKMHAEAKAIRSKFSSHSACEDESEVKTDACAPKCDSKPADSAADVCRAAEEKAVVDAIKGDLHCIHETIKEQIKQSEPGYRSSECKAAICELNAIKQQEMINAIRCETAEHVKAELMEAFSE